MCGLALGAGASSGSATSVTNNGARIEALGSLRIDAASSVRLQLQGDLANSGSILGRSVTDIRAQNIGNSGRIASNELTRLTAR
jgi:hypothetical protein